MTKDSGPVSHASSQCSKKPGSGVGAANRAMTKKILASMLKEIDKIREWKKDDRNTQQVGDTRHCLGSHRDRAAGGIRPCSFSDGSMALGAGMNERSCDHMIDTESPFCYLGLHFPNSCKGCSRYLQDGEHCDDHREKVWQEFVIRREIPGAGRYKL